MCVWRRLGSLFSQDKSRAGSSHWYLLGSNAHSRSKQLQRPGAARRAVLRDACACQPCAVGVPVARRAPLVIVVCDWVPWDYHAAGGVQKRVSGPAAAVCRGVFTHDATRTVASLFLSEKVDANL